ncbi:hypothetical protein B0H19DRAFT_963641, partial [Mycena capillaripes]
GIKRAGTSHLLLTRDERDAIQRESSRLTFLRWSGIRFTSADFESVSPIAFQNQDEFSMKLESLKPARQGPTDNSPANKAFQHAASGRSPRGQFENSRVLYRVLRNTISKNKCDLRDTSWSPSIRVFSLCYNTWSRDTRPYEERKNHPKLLDIGWCEASTPTLEGKNKIPKHVVIKENQNLVNPGKKDRYEYGETEFCSTRVATERIQGTFGKYAHSTPHPAVLLVHDADTALTVLRNLGLDVSLWDLELKNLLRSPVR